MFRPNSRAGDTTILASDLPSYNDLVELSAQLQDNGGRPMDNGDYVIVMAPQAHAALLKDPDFKEANKYANPDRIYKGQVNRLGNFNVIVSNAPAFTAPTTQATSGATNKIYNNIAIAMFAYQITDLQSLQMYSVAPGGQTDPLNAAAFN